MAKIVVIASLLLSLAGCSLTRSYSHEIIQSDLGQPYAKVYFLRPKTEHVQGWADNNLAVEVNGQRLVSLAKGEYTLLNLKPQAIDVTMRNKTQTRGRWEVEEMARTRRFELQDGQTYFIVAHSVDGEFRGVRFIATEKKLYEIREVARRLKATGLAASQPISSL